MATREAPGGSPADRLRLARIEIQDYKAIEHLALDFPPPSTPEELDVFVIGSRNGVGKTSVLECCALVVTGALHRDRVQSASTNLEGARPLEALVRAGADTFAVEATLDGSLRGPPEIRLTLHHRMVQVLHPVWDPRFRDADFPPDYFGSLLGWSTEPLVLSPVLFLHSYRKVRENHPKLDVLLRPPSPFQSDAFGVFKRVLVRALMARGGLFEDVGEADESAIGTLNDLMLTFAGGTVDKLRPAPDGALDLRVAPVGGGPSYSFDGLSSGQKELISTLFLIWHTTRDRPSIVLIDEPELHLNAEWQRLFVHHLGEVAPRNQYIMATHAEEIFASVPAERRLMLEPE